MILTETVLVPLNPSNIPHYEELGYFIPKQLDKQNRLCVKRGTNINVLVVHLPQQSHIKIICKCDNPNCVNPIREVSYYAYTPLCHDCALLLQKGINHPMFGKKHSQKTLLQLSISHIGNKSAYNPNITDGERLNNKRNRPGYNRSMNIAKKRDGKCLVCGSTKLLRGHHIQDFKHHPELANDPNNIITLCYQHHEAKNGKSIHNIYGKYPNKENLKDFLEKYRTI